MSFIVDTTEPCEEAAVINCKRHHHLQNDNSSQEQGRGSPSHTFRCQTRAVGTERPAPRGGSES